MYILNIPQEVFRTPIFCSWSWKRVSEWLSSFEFGKPYAQAFCAELITGRMLYRMDISTLVNKLGVEREHAFLILNEISVLKENDKL